MPVAPSPNEIVARLAPTLGHDRLRPQVPLAPYTTFRIGGPADVLYDATSATELATAVTAAREAGIPCFVLGLGANILVGDRGVRGLVVRNQARAHRWLDADTLWAESGATMAELIPVAVRAGRTGLEHYVGIPSTVGGAVWQNLHFLSPAPARERTMFIAEVVREVELLELATGARRTVDATGMRFGYDTSLLHDGGHIALAVTFALAPGDEPAMQRVMQENLSWRGARHPWLEHHPSAGSIFQKYKDEGAGRFIDQCGLKGYRVGDAAISHLHANIMVNLGQATAADVRALITHVQDTVEAKFGKRLQPEIGLIGEF